MLNMSLVSLHDNLALIYKGPNNIATEATEKNHGFSI